MAKGRAPKDFILDFSSDVDADFQLWLEDIHDYISICGVTDQAEKKTLPEFGWPRHPKGKKV